jgi:hypothetical protein
MMQLPARSLVLSILATINMNSRSTTSQSISKPTAKDIVNLATKTFRTTYRAKASKIIKESPRIMLLLPIENQIFSMSKQNRFKNLSKHRNHKRTSHSK